MRSELGQVLLVLMRGGGGFVCVWKTRGKGNTDTSVKKPHRSVKRECGLGACDMNHGEGKLLLCGGGGSRHGPKNVVHTHVCSELGKVLLVLVIRGSGCLVCV